MVRLPLHTQILLAMALGAALGLALNGATTSGWLDRDMVLQVAGIGEYVGKLFLALLQMVVMPLVFSAIVSSIAGLGDAQRIGPLGARLMTFYVFTTAAAVTTGLVLVNLLRPGDGMSYEALMAAARQEGVTPPDPTPDKSAVTVLAEMLARMIPSNVIDAASANTTILGVIFFAVLFGVFTLRVGGDHGKTIERFFLAVREVMMAMTHGILVLAPLGIFAYVTFITAATGLALAGALGLYMVTVALGLVFHAGVTLALVCKVVGRRSPLQYARDLEDALYTAFSTASSAATLPVTMECAVKNAKIPERVVSFALPLGASANMDGTALYEVVAVLFVAQMLGDLTIGQQAVVAVTALLAGFGTTGIPHAGTVMMVIVLQSVGLPTDAVLVILAVDRVLDMMRTTVNVWSDSVGAAIVARYDAELRPEAAP